jgi:hypothetical protein
MKQMVKHQPDAGCCAPVTILIDEGLMGCICLMTGWPVSSLPSSAEASSVAQELDSRIEALLNRATNSSILA